MKTLILTIAALIIVTIFALGGIAMVNAQLAKKNAWFYHQPTNYEAIDVQPQTLWFCNGDNIVEREAKVINLYGFPTAVYKAFSDYYGQDVLNKNFILDSPEEATGLISVFRSRNNAEKFLCFVADQKNENKGIMREKYTAKQEE
jgi:hypothetical protein